MPWYLGHNSVETTMIYTHVMRGLASLAVSPLDQLMGDAAAEGGRPATMGPRA